MCVCDPNLHFCVHLFLPPLLRAATPPVVINRREYEGPSKELEGLWWDLDLVGPATSKYVDTLLRYGKVCRGDDILYNTRHIDPTLR